jgi:hypothetical protein
MVTLPMGAWSDRYAADTADPVRQTPRVWYQRSRDAGSGGSQSGSQRPQIPGHVRPCPATVIAGKRYAGRRWARCSVWMVLIWEQEAAGSNPAIPTDRFFECVVSPCKQAATRRQLSPDVGRGGRVAVHVGCPVAPRCGGTRRRRWSNFNLGQRHLDGPRSAAGSWLLGKDSP